MRVIGIRAEPNAFLWAVSEGTLQTPILVSADRVACPTTFPFAKGANFLRSRLIQIIAENHVTSAGVRTPETMPRSTEALRQRLRIEGALLVACGEVDLEVTQGPLATMSRLLRVKSAKISVESDEFSAPNAVR
jgi:hypothetical protein